MRQVDHVNVRKDEPTIAVKGLADTAKQLVRTYSQQAATIPKFAEPVKRMEEMAADNSNAARHGQNVTPRKINMEAIQ